MPLVFLLVCLALIGLGAHFASGLIYGGLVRAGYAHAKAIRVVSFIAMFVGATCILGYIILAEFRFYR